MTNLIKVVIDTQFYENYGAHSWDGKGDCPQYWKPKGGQTFILHIDSDDLFYGEENCIEAFKRLLAKRSNNHYRYEYLSHEPIFGEEKTISTEDFYKELDIVLND